MLGFLFSRRGKKKAPTSVVPVQPQRKLRSETGYWGGSQGPNAFHPLTVHNWGGSSLGGPRLPSPHQLMPSALNGMETPLVPLQVKSRFGNLQHTPNIKALSNYYPVNTQHSSGLKHEIRSWFFWDHGPIVLTKGNFWLPLLLSGIEPGAWPKAVKPGSRGTETAWPDVLRPVLYSRVLWVQLACATPFLLLSCDQSKTSKQVQWGKRREIIWGAVRLGFTLALVSWSLIATTSNKASRNLFPRQKR